VHFIGQIRYPMGIYHAYWDQARWTEPSLIYMIAADEDKDFGDLIHAHDTHPVVRAGNQLVLTFGDSPGVANRRLFAMHRILSDISPLATVPTPTPTATPTPMPNPTPSQPAPVPPLTAAALSVDPSAAQPMQPAPGWDFALRIAIVPSLLLLAGAVVIHRWTRYRS
jgi:hypothetical protein